MSDMIASTRVIDRTLSRDEVVYRPWRRRHSAGREYWTLWNVIDHIQARWFAIRESNVIADQIIRHADVFKGQPDSV